eukprot:CAMPEP_0115554264 /NCGR_PEP_ID=MMETSP0271-20121206/97203_1 /TAXON_ID=71861 /ORGANISM="Scrippsiella trochoidea, Strain CCMP3099" /LENGTH=224 /DNA_ID=CAMNT_0002987983 /DNA_START=183 /DNA_END=858 /DNA_ORIENTATION=-
MPHVTYPMDQLTILSPSDMQRMARNTNANSSRPSFRPLHSLASLLLSASLQSPMSFQGPTPDAAAIPDTEVVAAMFCVIHKASTLIEDVRDAEQGWKALDQVEPDAIEILESSRQLAHCGEGANDSTCRDPSLNDLCSQDCHDGPLGQGHHLFVSKCRHKAYKKKVERAVPINHRHLAEEGGRLQGVLPASAQLQMALASFMHLTCRSRKHSEGRIASPHSYVH